MSAWRKFSVGPLRTVRCKHCGAALRIAWLPALLVILASSCVPVAGFIVAALLGIASLWGVLAVFLAVCAAGTVLSVWVYQRVPFRALQKHQPDSRPRP